MDLLGSNFTNAGRHNNAPRILGYGETCKPAARMALRM